MKLWTKFKVWLRTVTSIDYWRAKFRRKSKAPVIGMTREEAIAKGFINPKADEKFFDRMDAWPNETLEPLTLESAAQQVPDVEQRAKLKQEIAHAEAKRKLGTGDDVNSLAWRELMERMNRGS